MSQEAKLIEVKNVIAVSKDTYEGKDGKPKRVFTTIGSVFVYDNGNESMKLDFMPIDMVKHYINIVKRDNK